MSILSRRSKGQTMVLAIAALPALIAAIALCTDVLVMYYNWEILQKAADAAVLAGGSALPSDVVGAQKGAKDWAKKNGVLDSEIVGDPVVSNGNTQISMTLKRTVPYAFGLVLG